MNLKDFNCLRRTDGRIEWACKHGVGHTIYAPKIEQSDGTIFEDYSHGCDMCCSIETNNELLKKLEENKECLDILKER